MGSLGPQRLGEIFGAVFISNLVTKQGLVKGFCARRHDIFHYLQDGPVTKPEPSELFSRNPTQSLNRRNPSFRNRNQNWTFVKTVLQDRQPFSSEDPSESRAGTARTVPCTNRNQTNRSGSTLQFNKIPPFTVVIWQTRSPILIIMMALMNDFYSAKVERGRLKNQNYVVRLSKNCRNLL